MLGGISERTVWRSTIMIQLKIYWQIPTSLLVYMVGSALLKRDLREIENN